GDAQVVFAAKLKESFEAGARMLGALPFLAMRKQQHQAARLPPFGFRRREELVDDHLRAICEITELRLPDHQRQGIGDAVAELETHHCELAQRAVVDVEARLSGELGT